MKFTQPRYYVSRKNGFTWLAACLAVASAALNILALCFGEELPTVDFWFQKVLPIAAALVFALQVLLCGQKSLYRTTTPVFWACVYFGQVAYDVYLHPQSVHMLLGSNELLGYLRYVILCWILYFVIYMVYRLYMTGKFHHPIALSVTFFIPLAALALDLTHYIGAEQSELWYLLDKCANVAMVASIFVLTLAVRPFSDGAYHKTWGDRKDGRRLRTLGGMSVVAGYIMPDRNDACNSLYDTLEISAVERYIHRKRAEGLSGFGVFHVFLAAYVRCIAKYPGCNRFFSGQRVYQRDDDIQFVMAVKKDMRTDSPDTMIKLHLSRSDTAEDVYRKLNAEIEKVKNTPLDSSFDNLAGLLASIPGLLLKFTVWCLKVVDYFGLLPRFLTELSPFHGSIIFTSMGSLGIPPIVHHLYNFGNLPVFMAVGRKYRKTETDADGNTVTRRYVDIALNTDERTVDGFYYAAVLKYFHSIVRNPAVLDNPPAEIAWDIE